MTLQTLTDSQQTLARLELAATRKARRLWNRTNPDDIHASWQPLSNQLADILAGIQIRVAETAADANLMMLAEQHEYVRPLAIPDTAALAGTTAQGQPLREALQAPATATLHAIKTGAPPLEAMQTGRTLLTLITALAVNDVARQAAQLDIATRPGVSWVRVEAPNCCDRCMILAGKIFQWNEGFLRHPHCHGRHVPVTSRDKAKELGYVTDPMDEFLNLTREQQDRIFGRHSAQAIRDGADIYQVVNAKRGMTKIGRSQRARGYFSMTTTEGTTRYGWSNMIAGQRGRTQKRRLTVDAIYTLSRSREQAVELLKREGYILPDHWKEDVPDIRRSLWLHNNDWRQGRHETMTAAQKRVQNALLRYEAALAGHNPYLSNAPVTPEILAQTERQYRHWLSREGQIYTQ